MGTETDTGDTGFDISAAVDDVASGLGMKGAAPDSRPDDAPPPEGSVDTAATRDTPPEVETQATDKPAETETATPTVKPPPKSWAREKHELWSKLPPEAQDYYETREKQFLDGIEQYKGEATFGKTIRDVFQPYKPILNAQGIDEPSAIRYLMNAHFQLTQGTMESRVAAYKKLGAELRLADASTASAAPAQSGAPVPPELKDLQTRFEQIESKLTAREQADLDARQAALESQRQTILKEVTAFAEDKEAHPHFDAVADDISRLVGTGLNLAEAYEKAVWANPATRQLEISRIQTENENKLKVEAQQRAEAARRGAAANVKARETRRAPTEPVGSMEDTLRETFRAIQNRSH